MADQVTDIPASTPAPEATSAPDYAAFADRMSSSLNAPETPASAPAEPVAAAPATDTTTAATAPESTATTPETPASTAAFNEAEWVRTQFGDTYKTPAEIQAALQEREALKTNQITDEQRASLALLSDAETRREYLRLADADYDSMNEVEVLRQDYQVQHPGMSADELDLRFERWLRTEFPAAAGVDPEHPDFEETPDYVADKKLMGFQVAKSRQDLAAYRDERTTALLAGVKQAAPESATTPATTSAEDQQVIDAHFAKVGELVKAPLDITVDLPDGQKVSIKARETPEEIEAAEQVMRDPFGDYQNFLYPDGKNLDYNALELWTAFRTQGSKLFSTAVAIGRDSVPAHVTLDGLTNGGTPAATPAPVTNDPAGFAARMAASMNL